ncbi:sulfotransferase domain-containing protein [Oceanihabitans sediminis]|uniref:sulfotransferase domain-containing protein n=1 Tax=Oceanihabitans sediminis TaxID=1812012 RepID=UPI00299DF3A4|nr:sulfotransferase domain-containing protein [Oceanihabitans sediminis]MDX1365565.1 sulfotransferase domain-containing protein [Arenibacter latericius]MDX1774841.1 sulfotransferase domain-containing protein [Oceanihabitans sediminis]
MALFQKHIVIVGSARSGTSWLSEVIARQFRYRMLFEPEHEFNTQNGKLICDKWLRAEANSTEANRYLKKVFKNRVDSDWIGQISNRKYKMHLWPFLPKKYIIKFVRANLSAKYLNENFKVPLIHIIRNPYDVLASQQRVKFPWLYNLEHFKQQKDLVQVVKENFKFDLIEDTKPFTPLETLTVRWCLENVLPLQILEPYKYKHRIVKHEDLRNDLGLFLELCDEFNIEPLSDIEKEYQRPSSKTHPKSEIINEEKKTSKFTIEELDVINNLLDIFNCNLYPRIQA